MGELAREFRLEIPSDAESVVVTDVTEDSRSVTPGSLFVCVRGRSRDGHDFAAEAVSRGAVAVLAERRLGLAVPTLVVPDTRAFLGPVASAVAGHPSRRLDVIGVTGTDGKTTTVSFVTQILTTLGVRAESIGTLTGERTTPPAPELQRRLRGFVDAGVRAVAIEVSSHALDQRRVDGCEMKVGVFTMLGRDHLDYHGSLEAYFRAKARMFEEPLVAVAVVNMDDPSGRRIAESSRARVVGYSLADARDLTSTPSGFSFEWRGRRAGVRLVGEHNLMNALAAATAVSELGHPDDDVASALGELAAPRGRLERVDCRAEFEVFVDYAHTPDALATVLRALRARTQNRLILVFGCGGDRDPSKRPVMGSVAAELADLVFVTSDNPRSEDPDAIIRQILEGMSARADVRVEVDRRAAIRSALEHATVGDVVLIAGRGHETHQEIDGKSIAFDDAEVVREEFGSIGGEDPGGDREFQTSTGTED